jgi:hypothetical protein
MSLRGDAEKATFVFLRRMDAAGWTDAQVRLTVKVFRETLLQRQQERATKKYLAQTSNRRNDRA